jgi:predicted membrane channel-forming protein YqfA (hemolysin III family)
MLNSLWDVFLYMLWFFLFILWIWLVITVFADIFRSSDLSGWGKFGWTALIIIVPYLGVFIYLIARGKKMGEHAVSDAKAQDQAMRAYVRDAAGSTTSAADEIQKLAALQKDGQISAEEFQQAKAKILS